MARAKRIAQRRSRPAHPRAIGAALGALLVLAVPAPSAAFAGVQSLVLPVRGMTCPLCTRGVEESIKLLDGVGSATADLTTGIVRVEAREGSSLVIQQVKERILRAGFHIGGECEMVASGRFTIGSERRIMLRIPGTSYAFQVLEGGELLRLIRSHPGLKGDYVLRLRVHDHPNWKPPAVSITGFEAAPAPPSRQVAGR